MEMTWKDWTFILFLGVLTFAVPSYGFFRLGAWKERKDYTASFERQVEIAYWDGYTDGKNLGRKVGAEEGYKKGYDKCLSEDYELKDKY